MHFSIPKILTTLALTSLASAHVAPLKRENDPAVKGKRSYTVENGVNRTVFEHAASGTTIDFVTNSGICETTPGVNQYSGYVNYGQNESYWFWFFESRNSPRTAPLALWLNGGPGCSSMLGLFQEHGPCTFNYNNVTTPTLNPYSWNEYSNMLYVDQPFNTGFSYGDGTVNLTITAAPLVWKLLQAFFANFEEYENRDFGFFTESYGGHYGPGFAEYIEQQNTAITAHKIRGTPIHLIAFGINNGWYDAYIQELEYVSFSANNSYFPLINQSIATHYAADLEANCLPKITACKKLKGENEQCTTAQTDCSNVDSSYGGYYPNFDPFDIRQPESSPFPPGTYFTYLNDPEVVRKIGARSTYVECSGSVELDFSLTGDDARNFLPDLSSLVSSGLPTLLWAGDADSVCDWFGGFAVVNQIQYPLHSTFASTAVKNYTQNGVVRGTYKSVGNLNWIRVFESGHMVPSFQPEVSLQVFKQLMEKGTVCST